MLYCSHLKRTLTIGAAITLGLLLIVNARAAAQDIPPQVRRSLPHGSGSTFRDLQLDFAEETFTVIDKDGRRYERVVALSPFGSYSIVRQIAEDPSLPCQSAPAFECLKLKKAVPIEDGTVTKTKNLYAVPVPDIFHRMNDQDMSCDEDDDGKALTKRGSTWRTPDDVISIAQSVLVERCWEWSNAAWMSLEPIELVYDGPGALRYLEQLTQVEFSSDCPNLDMDQTGGSGCREYFWFESDKGDKGIVVCRLTKIGNVRSPPIECSVKAINRNKKWYVQSRLSPDWIAVLGGAGAEGLFCSIDIDMDAAVDAIKSTLNASPLNLVMRKETAVGDTVLLTGEKEGGASVVLAALGKGRYFEKLTFHGQLMKGDEGDVFLSGVLSVNVNRQSEALNSVAYELGAESSAYIARVAEVLAQKLHEKTGKAATCEAN
ncbi:MAG: hypothetical protein ABW172_15465 [Candidatus Binatia bacterium]